MRMRFSVHTVTLDVSAVANAATLAVANAELGPAGDSQRHDANGVALGSPIQVNDAPVQYGYGVAVGR